jgi:hypothetical protein
LDSVAASSRVAVRISSWQSKSTELSAERSAASGESAAATPSTPAATIHPNQPLSAVFTEFRSTKYSVDNNATAKNLLVSPFPCLLVFGTLLAMLLPATAITIADTSQPATLALTLASAISTLRPPG